MKVTLNENQIQAIKSMNDYWEEVSRRENQDPGIYLSELHSLIAQIGSQKILLIVGEYAKNFKSE